MKLTLLFLAALISVALGAGEFCNHPGDCNCHHNQVAVCTHHVCLCEHPAKREHVHQACTVDADCAGYVCHHADDTPFCHQHGGTDNPHNTCDCK